MNSSILKTLRYFLFFNYAPTAEEIRFFLEAKISGKELLNQLKRLIDSKRVKVITGVSSSLDIPTLSAGRRHSSFLHKKTEGDNINRYTLGEYPINIKEQREKSKNSKFKINKIAPYVKILSFLPQVRLVGSSGSVAMLNSEKDDDIDLFIITKANRMWTARFLCVFLGDLLNLRRKRTAKNIADKVCLNMFFDETSLVAPKFKQNLYIAHEILQMQSLINKNHSWERFIKANDWVFGIFPNAKLMLNSKSETLNSKQIQNPKVSNIKKLKHLSLFRISDLGFRIFGNAVEKILRKIQLILINRTKTTEIVTDTQLWFFPDDFEAKILKKV